MSHLTLHEIDHPIILKNATIKKLEMLGIKTDVNLVNVSIAYLAVVGCPSATFDLNNCFIGDLILQGNCVRNFYVAEGAIFNIQCPPPRSENPFNGSVHFDKKVYYPEGRVGCCGERSHIETCGLIWQHSKMLLW